MRNLHTLFARVRPLLETRRLPLLAACVAIVLTSPSLFGSLATEDWIQRNLVTSGLFPLPSHVNLFGHPHPFSDAEIATRDYQYQLYGWFPWITDGHFDASFWRPVASLTHHFDYRLFPEHPWVMHAESILWYAALVAGVAVLYTRLVTPRWAAGLAALLYAADDAHGHPVGWLINRNAVMASAFSIFALLAYDRFRRDDWKPGAVLTTASFALGLCSAEFALCAGGYFVAYGIFVERGPLRRRLLAALPWLIAIAGWAIAYRALGHTAHGSGLYIDPWRDPMSYAFELFERGSVLLMGLFGAPFSDTWTTSGLYAQGLIVFWAVLLLWAVGTVLWPLLVRDRMARFWLCGLVFSLPPACATFPEDRMLLLAGVGAFPLIAQFVASAFAPEATESRAPARRLTLAAATAWLVLHAVVAPLLLPYRSLHMYRYDREIAAAGESAFQGSRPDQSLILINGENFYVTGMMPILHASLGFPTPSRVLALAGTFEDVTVTRQDPLRLLVRPRYGFLSRVFNRIYRGRALGFTRGSHVSLLGVDIAVSDVNQWGEPTAAVFTFDFPLESDHYRWVAWKHGRYEPFALPPVGTTVVVNGSG